jgi:hypothetical protein
MMRWGVISLAIGAMLLLIIMPGNLDADLSGEVEFGPNEPFSGEVNEFRLTFRNTGDRDIVLTDARAVIDFPSIDFFDDQYDPDVTIDFLDEEVLVPAGEEVTLRRSVRIDLHGGFSVPITVKGHYAGEMVTNILETSSWAHCTERQLLDRRDPFGGAVTMFIFLFGAGMLGFFVRGAYWDYEIKRNMEEEELDALQWYKWFDQLWWRRGQRTRVLLLYATIALTFSLLVYLMLS